MTAGKFSSEDLRFQACLAFTLKYEGGGSDDPRDPGGRTMEGVTQATYDAYCVERALGRRDVFTMTAPERDEIYHTEYWDAVKAGGMLPGEDLATFDLAVNSGPAKALSIRAGVLKTPGISTSDLISGICARRLSFLQALRTWSAFGAGWGKRVAACEAAALKMAGADLGQAAAAAKASMDIHKRRSRGTAAAGAASAAGLHHFLVHGLWAVAAAVGVVAVAIAVSSFNAWRHGQRADALTQAVNDMRAAAAKAAAAHAEALTQAIAKEEAIATDQAELAAAKAEIAKNQPPQAGAK